MAEVTLRVSDVLEKALMLSTQDRGVLIDRLIESLDDGPAEEGVEAAWAEEIKTRVDDIRSGRVKMIPGEQVLRELEEEFPDESERFRFHPEARIDIRDAMDGTAVEAHRWRSNSA